MSTRTVAWFHCFSGIAGDMALGALFDAGADVDAVRRMLDMLPVGGWQLEVEPVLRGGVAATKAHVHARDEDVVRTAAHITALVEEARLPDRVRDRAMATFRALAEAEGRLHRRSPEQVHFHEVGGLDAIVDVVGTCAALEVLGVDEVHASSLATGTGMIRSSHGMLPNPAPATVEVLAAAGAPSHGVDVPVELTTPTGAALVAALATRYGPLPALELRATGFGAGSRELDDRPNAVQVVIGRAAGDAVNRPAQPVVLVETNVDDVTGELLAHTIARLMDAGAHDAWVTPIVMKKGRPAHTVSALADVALAGVVAEVLAAETGSLGVRATSFDRWPSSRELGTVEVAGRPVRVKVGPGRIKVEHDDAARVAGEAGMALRDVISLAEEAGRRRYRPTDLDDEPA